MDSRFLENILCVYVSRWTSGIPLIVLVVPISPGQTIPDSGFSPLISPALLPPVTAAFVK